MATICVFYIDLLHKAGLFLNARLTLPFIYHLCHKMALYFQNLLSWSGGGVQICD